MILPDIFFSKKTGEELRQIFCVGLTAMQELLNQKDQEIEELKKRLKKCER